MKKIRLIVFWLTLSGAIIWMTLILLAPYLRVRYPILSGLIYASFSPVCHQIPSRCFYLFGFPLAVCSRCLGIYSGFFTGILAYPIIRGFSKSALPNTRTFLFLSTPIVLDTIGNFWGLWSTSLWLRFFFGLSWGIILPYYFITGLIELFLHLKNTRKTSLTFPCFEQSKKIK